jgi:hypothetical protein
MIAPGANTHLLTRHHDRTHDEEPPEHSYVTITEQEDLRQRGLL